jgi:thioredoxin 1
MTNSVHEAMQPESRGDQAYRDLALAPDALAAMRGWKLLDFGTDWCGHCIAARAAVDVWLEPHAHIEHLRIEDGRGRPLGRAHRVKLWPTLVLIRDGRELARVVRPREARDLWPLHEALQE